MRILFGIILGAVLTVGGAYIYDFHSPAAATQAITAPRPLVNWDVVSDKWQQFTDRARIEWNRHVG